MILDAGVLVAIDRDEPAAKDFIVTSDLDDFARLTAHLGEAEPRARHWR